MRKFLLGFACLLFLFSCKSPAKSDSAQADLAKKSNQPSRGDLDVRKKFAEQIVQWLDTENFYELEKEADRNTKQKERFPGGDWKLERFYDAISPPGGYNAEHPDWKLRLSHLQKWVEKKPDSIYANIALARGQIGYAWDLRAHYYTHSSAGRLSIARSMFMNLLGLRSAFDFRTEG